MYNNDSLEDNGNFKELPFYNTYVEKPKIRRVKNIDLLSELSFYEELNVIKNRYAMSYKGEFVVKKDSLNQLEASKSSIKDLLNDLLDETKGLSG